MPILAKKKPGRIAPVAEMGSEGTSCAPGRTLGSPSDSLVQPLKIHGGKHYTASWIVSLFPPRCANPNKPSPQDIGWLHYVEPYAGGLSVLLANDPHGISEVVNDLNGNIAAFWKVMRSTVLFREFQRLVESTEVGESVFNVCQFPLQDEAEPALVERAYRLFVLSRQSRAGGLRSFSPVTRRRTRRDMNAEVSAWLSAIDGLQDVHERLRRVVVLDSQDALNVIRRQDGPRTLFYLDPPYLKETRTARKAYGAFEMMDDDHRELLITLNSVRGRFLLSGYHSDLYDDWASQSNFKCHEYEIDNKASGSAKKRTMTECVWTNY